MSLLTVLYDSKGRPGAIFRGIVTSGQNFSQVIQNRESIFFSFFKMSRRKSVFIFPLVIAFLCPEEQEKNTWLQNAIFEILGEKV